MASLNFGNFPVNMNDADILGLGGVFSDQDLVLESLSANQIELRDPGTNALVTFQGAFDLTSQTTLNNSIFVALSIQDGALQPVLNLQGVSATVGSALNSTNDATYFQSLLGGADVVVGGDQNDILKGYGGDDTIVGGDGADSLGGGDGNDNLQGGAGIDTLQGGAGFDTLDGGLSNDTLVGGGGNDVYANVDLGDTVTEQSSQGYDAVLTFAAFTLPANVEALVLQGAANVSGTGNGLNNVISGTTGDNILSGLGGNDTLDGGDGSDTLDGGAGDDTFVINTAADAVIEAANQGVDQVITSVTYTLGANVEKLTQTGTADIDGTGNAAANTMVGNAGINVLLGGDGNDNIDGGAGNDELGGEAGNDVLKGGAGNDLLDGGVGSDNMNGGNGNDTFVVNVAGDVVTEGPSAGTDTVRALVNYTLGANLENLELGAGGGNLNGTGNGLANIIIGNEGNNTLDAKAGADTMTGGDGDDTFIVDNLGDGVSENALEGEDLVQSSVNFALSSNVENLVLTGSAAISGTGNALANEITGNGANNTLTGDAGDDTLKGGEGVDTMSGGLGDDTFFINTLSDVTNENAFEGNDTIRSSITLSLLDANRANIENATLTGTNPINVTGSGIGNVLNGNTAANTLDGRPGADTMNGNKGNDTYLVDDLGDTVVEDFTGAAGGGTDLVKSSVNFALGANVEKLTLTGANNINGTGNALNNTLVGNTGNNILDGLGGNDNMNGGNGDDTYRVDAPGDVVTESSAGGGTDTVQSSIAYTLGVNVENLTLLSNGNINGTGNGLANTIIGNTGNNTLNGKGGNDTLTGGDAADIFRFTTAPNTATNNDTITDFTSGEGDTIQLENGVFTNLAAGPLNVANFFTGAAITDTSGADGNDFIKYDTTIGALYYDTNGNAAGGMQQIGTLTGAPALAATDIDVT